jgi:hypothetical protein
MARSAVRKIEMPTGASGQLLAVGESRVARVSPVPGGFRSGAVGVWEGSGRLLGEVQQTRRNGHSRSVGRCGTLRTYI